MQIAVLPQISHWPHWVMDQSYPGRYQSTNPITILSKMKMLNWWQFDDSKCGGNALLAILLRSVEEHFVFNHNLNHTSRKFHPIRMYSALNVFGRDFVKDFRSFLASRTHSVHVALVQIKCFRTKCSIAFFMLRFIYLWIHHNKLWSNTFCAQVNQQQLLFKDLIKKPHSTTCFRVSLSKLC